MAVVRGIDAHLISFPEYEGAESDMLTQLALDLKDRNLSDGMLVKLVLINISAQNYALIRAPSTYR